MPRSKPGLLLNILLLQLVQAPIDGIQALNNFGVIIIGAVLVLDLNQRREGNTALE
jgi:hypothetical protein